MVGNGGEIGQHFSRRQSTVSSPRRLSRNADTRVFDSLMEFPKLLQRGASFKAPAPARYQQLHYSNVHNTRSACQKKIWVASLLCLSCFLVLYFSLGRRSPYLSYSLQRSSKGYGAVIDIGRQEARINIFQFEDTETLALKVLGSKPSLAPLGFQAPGGAYDVSTAFVELLEYAKRNIPELERPQTRVYVLGTGGLEWVPAKNRGDLLQECRKFIHESEFQFHDEWATVINGRDEGVYDWVAANYAHGTLQSDPADTIGVLTLGDESAQVTFVSEKTPPPAYLHKIELWGTTHNLYSYSFEKLGLETASKSLLKLLHSRTVTSLTDRSENKVVLDQCTPRGYGGPNHDGNELAGAEGDTTTSVKVYPTVPMGNFTACRAESLALLQQGQDACLDKNCPIGTIIVPELRGNFIATRKFYETSKYFSLPATASLADLAAAGENYCGQGGGVHKDLFPAYEEVRKPCFSAAFVMAFLHDSLGLPVNGNKVMFTDAVNSVPVEWTVGFLLTHLLEAKASPPVVIFGEFFGNVALFLGLFAIVGVLVWFVARWRRPQLKTIYDLEKGRYFTTAARGR